MILRIILIAILIFLFIRISQRLLAGIRSVTGAQPRQSQFRNQRSNRNSRFEDIEEADYEDISDKSSRKE